MSDTGPDSTMTAAAGVAWWRDLQTATAVLTRLPFGREGEPEPEEVADSMRAFPLVGLGLGLAAAFVYAGGMSLGLWPVLSALSAVALLVVATGARNEVGLARFADRLGAGVGAKGRRAQTDGRLGAAGALALLFTVAFRVAAVAAMGAANEAAAALLAAAAGARAVIPIIAYNLPAAESGDPAPWDEPPSQDRLWTGGALGVAFVLLFLGPVGGIVAVLLAAAAAAAVAVAALRRFGGHDRDSLALAQQAAEIGILLAAVAAA